MKENINNFVLDDTTEKTEWANCRIKQNTLDSLYLLKNGKESYDACIQNLMQENKILKEKLQEKDKKLTSKNVYIEDKIDLILESMSLFYWEAQRKLMSEDLKSLQEFAKKSTHPIIQIAKSKKNNEIKSRIMKGDYE